MKKSELPEPLGLTPMITGAKLRECKTYRGMKRHIILLIPIRVLGAIILPEWLIVREREEFACRIMTFTDCQALVNGQLSTGRWKVPNRGKLISCSTVAICSATAKLYLSLPQSFFTWSTTYWF